MLMIFFRTLALGVMFALASASHAQSTKPLKLGVVTWIGYGPLYVAESRQLWKKYGYRITLQNFTDPALLPAAIASGALDGGLITYDQLVAQVAKGDSMRAVMPLDFSNGGDAIVATTDIKDIPSIKGHKVAFAPLSPSDFLLAFALRKSGMKDSDVQPVHTGPETVPATIGAGTVKVGVTYEPMVSQITAMEGGKKFHVIYSSKQSPGLLSDVLVFTAKAMKDKPEMVKTVIRGYLDAMALMKAKPAETAKPIAKALGINEAEVAEQQKTIYALSLPEMLTAFTKSDDPQSFYVACEAIADILLSKKEIPKLPKCEDTMETKFISALLAK